MRRPIFALEIGVCDSIEIAAFGCSTGCLSTARQNVSFGINVQGRRIRNNARSKGSTVLNLAIWSLHEASVEALLKAGANPNLAEPDEAGYTALHMACARRRPRLIHLLLAAGANPELQTKYGEAPLEVLKAYRCFPSGERCYQLLKDLLEINHG